MGHDAHADDAHLLPHGDWGDAAVDPSIRNSKRFDKRIGSTACVQQLQLAGERRKTSSPAGRVAPLGDLSPSGER
jgi:hypothetical protein